MNMDIPSYNQRDGQWAADKINGTASTLGKYGCTITCIGDMTGRTPRDANNWLKSLGAFQNDLVLWSKVPNFVFRFYCTTTAAPIAEIKKYLDQRKPVLLNVSFEKNTSKPNHWVLATGYDGNTIYINDPWYGDKSTVAPRYGSTSAIAILGGAYFNTVVSAPTPPPPPVDPCQAVKNDLEVVTARLVAKEKELAVCAAKPPVIKEVIVEVPVEKIVENIVEKIVIQPAEEMSAWQMIIGGLAKLLPRRKGGE